MEILSFCKDRSEREKVKEQGKKKKEKIADDCLLFSIKNNERTSTVLQNEVIIEFL